MIDVESVSKSYGSKLVIDDISFSVPTGKITGFLGPNGAGKTTMMRLMVGLDKPSSGVIRIKGKCYAALDDAPNQVGVLLETTINFSNRTAYKHLLWQAQMKGVAPSRITTVLQAVGLEEYASKNASAYSLGMRQRLGLASVLLSDPEVLILDEPLNGLDPEGIKWVRLLLKTLAGEGRTILVSSHLLAEVSLVADNLIIINQGKLLSDLPFSQFVDRYSQHGVSVAAADQDALAQALTDANLHFRFIIDSDRKSVIEVDDVTADEVSLLAFKKRIRLVKLYEREAKLEEAYFRMISDAVEKVDSDAH